ncbi:protein CYPRO4-like [Iris pallida]|uniref:Protein CYPRO4-like n=1 Tax=Iris pallida TaxID=29817 RepID=A0AAX6F6S5_IRIPA|nr:protein CYPRO4-like [Iris pallida]
MGGSHSREGMELSESEEEEEEEEETIDHKLESLTLNKPSPNPNSTTAKLYLHVGGSSPSAKWILSDKLASYNFHREEEGADGAWFLTFGSRTRTRVGPEMQLKAFPDQLRLDFVADEAVWAVRFPDQGSYRTFQNRYERSLFENTYGLDDTEANRTKVFGKEFSAWADPELADDSIWEDAKESLQEPPPYKRRGDLLEEFEEAAGDDEGVGIRSLALGALENSFLVGDSGIQVVKNFIHGIHGKGLYVKLSPNSEGTRRKKALLMKAETNMLLMTPGNRQSPAQSTGVNQLDIETGKIVTEWRFEKDGTDITMRDISNDSKGSQLDPSESTFLGLDDSRLCRWDMRDKRGVVQDLATSASSASTVLEWTQGHQFARGTNFQCFASTGDGSIVVGSLDGKIRLYSKNSMRMAKTAFPGLGSPVTHVDVTYDGKWILGTTDRYLLLISTVFKDQDGKEKTGFSGRMGSRIAAPRMLKLTPLDSHLAGKDNKFHGGQFSWVTENGKQERHLVATVGKFSIVWNFQQVKNSKHECYRNQEGMKSCYCYKIVLKDESIVDSCFMHEKFAVKDSPEAPLVVATPMKVTSFSISNQQ